MVTAANAAISAAVATKTTAKDSDAMPPPNHERRLTFRFLTLPFRHQIAIADSLNVLTDEDRALSDEALFRELFKRAAAKGLLAKLWDETEKRHADPAPFKTRDITVTDPRSVLSGMTVEELGRAAKIQGELEERAKSLPGAVIGRPDGTKLVPMLCASTNVKLDDPDLLYELKLDVAVRAGAEARRRVGEAVGK